MELHLKRVLSLPRNAKIFPKNREKVGGFIFKSLAKSGVMVGSYKFNYRKVTIDDQKVISVSDREYFKTSQFHYRQPKQ